MTSRRSILLGMMIVAFMAIVGLNTASAQVPRSISYQGLLVKSGQPVTGKADLVINIYNSAGTKVFTETFLQTDVNNGIFNVSIGSVANPLSPTMKSEEHTSEL